VRQLCNEVRRIVAYSESNSIVTPDALSQEIIKHTSGLDDPVAAMVAGHILWVATNAEGRVLRLPMRTGG
jgi:hypothetical protein